MSFAVGTDIQIDRYERQQEANDEKTTVQTVTISFGFIWSSFCSNGGGLGKVPTRRRGGSVIKWKVGVTWLFIDLVRDLRASEKRA